MSNATWDYLWDKQIILKHNETHSCNCIGSQKGQPACPCRMKGISIKDGRYVEIIDYGPVK